MSSLDSALNSLSAASYRDFLVKLFPGLGNLSDKKQVQLSRWLTILWGLIATGFALRMIGGSETVLELENKIGSAFYGPILAAFWLGMLTRRANQAGVVSGLLAGVAVNIFLWQFYGQAVSWLWWNVIGFAVSFVIGYSLSYLQPQRRQNQVEGFIIHRRDFGRYLGNKKYYFLLSGAFLLMLLVSGFIEHLLG